MKQECETAKEALHRVIVDIEDFLDGQWDGNREGWEATARMGREALRRLTDDD
jgi:hypothetical protein